jgi:predicted nucleic acid-binding protein
MLIVSNTSPLSNLGMIGQLPLLQQIYPKVIIPPMVHRELMRLSVIQPEITFLITQGWLEIQPVTDQPMLQILSNGV